MIVSHRWRGTSTENTYFSSRQCFYRQGLILVSRCSQLSAAGTPLLRGRPGHENCQAVGPAARLAWCAGSGRSHSKSDGPTIDLTQFQPRTPGRSLGGNALSGFSSILASQNGPQRRRWGLPEKLEKNKFPIKKKVRPDFSDRTFLFYQGLSCADDAPSPQPPARRRTEPEHPAPGSAGRCPRSGARQSPASGWPQDWWRSRGRGWRSPQERE